MFSFKIISCPHFYTSNIHRKHYFYWLNNIQLCRLLNCIDVLCCVKFWYIHYDHDAYNLMRGEAGIKQINKKKEYWSLFCDKMPQRKKKKRLLGGKKIGVHSWVQKVCLGGKFWTWRMRNLSCENWEGSKQREPCTRRPWGGEIHRKYWKLKGVRHCGSYLMRLGQTSQRASLLLQGVGAVVSVRGSNVVWFLF